MLRASASGQFATLLVFFLACLQLSPFVLAQECDASKECAIGCCSKWGFCGLGPDFCAKDICVNNCDRKADCDPGYGMEWAKKSKCPLNVCCSKHGFCGTTKEFCGDEVIEKKKCSKDGHLERVVGYYEGWAARRPCNAFFPEMIPRGVYSIINFAFATIDPVTFEVLPSSPEDVDLYGRLTALKQHDPGLKVFIALGGWTFNDEGPTMTTFSDISRSEANQRKFFKSLIAFLHKYDFDGVDLDWEYPVADDRFGRPEDFGNFPKMMLNLKNELKHTGGRNGLSITLPASFWYLQHFDLAGLKKSVDFFAVMSYDLHGTWDMGKKWTGEYLNPHTNITEIDAALDLLWRNDIDPGMVVMGLAFYARSYTLADPSCTEPRCTYVSASRKGKCSNEAGILLNSEIDDIVKERGLTPVLWEKETVKVVHWDDQWLSYDDAETLKMKADYARSLCLGGVMVWAISHDTTGLGSGVLGKRQNGASTLVGKYTRALAKVTNRKATDGRSLTDPDDEEERYEEIKVHHPVCRWTGCLENCPSGWQHMKREDDRARKDEYMWDETGCDKTGSHKLCCPPNEKKPTCGWYTHPKKGGKCKSECPAGTLEIGGNSMYCSSSYQAACCTVDDDQGKGLRAMDVYDTCNWAEAPLCDWGTCGDREELVLSTSGNGGAICNVRSFEWGKSVTIQQRKYCCDQNDNKKKWDNCQWYDKEGDYEAGLRCSPNCPKDKTRVAMDSWGGDCRDSGARVYCCDTDNYHLEKREIDDGLGAYRTAMGWFVKDPTCPATVSSDGDEWTIDDAEIERRQQPPDIGYSRIQLVHNLLSTVLEQAYQVPTRAQQDMMDLWDDYIKGNWPGLVVRLLVPYILDQYATAYKVEGARKTADRILCALDVFNQMVQALKTALICSDNLCGVDDLCSDSFDEDAQPKSNPLRVRQDMNEIEKRRPMNVGGDINWDCIDDANPNGRRIRWKKADYFSVNDWDDANTIYDNALRPIIPGHCSLTRLATVDYEFEPDTRPYCTEHIIEMQSMKIFFGEAANGMISGCNLPCDFFLNGWNDPALLGGLGPAPGGYQTGKPSERVMEAVGSDDNTANFAILEADLNGMKARIWRYLDPISSGSWTTLVNSNDPCPALQSLRNAIAVFNYLNHPYVRPKLLAINRDIRDEFQNMQDAWNFGHPLQQINPVDCWDAWFKEHLEDMVSNTRAWVKQGIIDMKTRWNPLADPGDVTYTATATQVWAHTTLLSVQGFLQNQISFDTSALP